MKIKLTKEIVEKTEPGATDLFLWDSELPGFGCKITPNRKRTYVAQYRAPDGRTRRLSLGRHGVVTIDQARKKAKEKLGAAALGEDPATEKLEARHSPTIEDLGKRYLAEHATKKKASSAGNDKWLLDKIIYPRIGTIKTLTISRTDVAKLHHDLREKPYIANRTLALFSKMMNLAEAWGERPDNSNPCRHVEKFKETKRRRFLSTEELGRLGNVLSTVEQTETEPAEAIAAIRLLIFTGARLSEILTLRWEYVSWEFEALVLPDSKTGSKTIPLSGPARRILENLPSIEGNPYVLPGHRHGQHLVALGHIWNRIRAAAEISDVRLHDLRHSYASVGAASGLGLPIIGALLGHTQASTTQRYAHLAQDPLKAAAELISTKINAAMKEKTKKVRMVK
jgi:integrase